MYSIKKIVITIEGNNLLQHMDVPKLKVEISDLQITLLRNDNNIKVLIRDDTNKVLFVKYYTCDNNCDYCNIMAQMADEFLVRKNINFDYILNSDFMYGNYDKEMNNEN